MKVLTFFLSFSLLFIFQTETFAQDSSVDPVAVLNQLTGGKISADDFKKQIGLDIREEDRDMVCKISSFNLVRVSPNEDPVEVIVRSAEFNEKALGLVQSAAPGDTYYFDKVMASCPTTPEPRRINALVFKIE